MNTSRPPPPSGAPPSYAFVNRVYTKSLRPMVLFIATISALWALFSAVGFFRSVGVDKQEKQTALANLSIALGALYMAICILEVFGIVAAFMQRLPLIRIYAFISMFAGILAAASGLVRVVVHFAMKNNLISECTTLSTGDEVVFRFGPFGPTRSTVLNEDDANKWCKKAWDHDSVSEIVEMLIIIFLAGLFASLSFAYYRQMLDPTSPANASRAPSYQARMGGAAYPQHYNPPYNASVPNLGYGYNMPYAGGPAPYGASQQQFAPPPGPPPGQVAPPYDAKGYSGMAGDDKKDNDPFADFDDERDVTSKPGVGGRERF